MPIDFEAYKRSVDLVALAERYGYQRVRGKSSVRQVVLDHPTTQDRVVITRAQTGPWYFNPHDDQDKGTVIDFLLRREGGDWQRVQAVLQGQLPALAPVVPPGPRRTLPDLPDFQGSCQPLRDRSYLHARGLHDRTLDHPSFAGRIFTHGRHVAFPLYRGQTWVGLDLKGPGFKGYAPGSRKGEGCWYSDPGPLAAGEGTLLLTESALDALAYHQLYPASHRLSLSLGGTPSRGQQHLIQLLCDSLRPQRVLLACDADAAGQRLNLQLVLGLDGPSGPRVGFEGLLEAIGPRRSRLSVGLGPELALQQAALPLLLSGLAGPMLTVLGPQDEAGQTTWSLSFDHDPALLSALTRLVISLRGLGEWLSLTVPSAKDWAEVLVCGDV
jgi:hypothetical protein